MLAQVSLPAVAPHVIAMGIDTRKTSGRHERAGGVEQVAATGRRHPLQASHARHLEHHRLAECDESDVRRVERGRERQVGGRGSLMPWVVYAIRITSPAATRLIASGDPVESAQAPDEPHIDPPEHGDHREAQGEPERLGRHSGLAQSRAGWSRPRPAAHRRSRSAASPRTRRSHPGRRFRGRIRSTSARRTSSGCTRTDASVLASPGIGPRLTSRVQRASPRADSGGGTPRVRSGRIDRSNL